MKYFKLILCFLVVLSISNAADEIPRLHDEYDPERWPETHLVFSQAGTLKDVFDSGLRPYRHPGLENSVLEVKHLNLTIQFGSGKRLPKLAVEWMNIKVFTDGELATVEAATPKLTLEKARAEMIKWLPYGVNGRTEKDLDEYLKVVETDYLDFDDPYRGVSHGCSIQWREPGWKEKGGGPQVVAWFRKTASATHPLRVYFKATWSSNRPQRDRGTYRPDPIPPPPGYEHVDMTAPAKFGPDSMVDILRSKGVDIGDGKGGIPQEEYFARQAAADQIPSGRKTETDNDERVVPMSESWWLTLLLVPLLLLLFAIWRRRRNDLLGG